MKNQLARAHPFTRVASRLVILMLFAALLLAAPFHAALAQDLGSAGNFAALAGGPAAGAVTLTNSTVIGDVGVVDPGTLVNVGSTITGIIDDDATGAYSDFLDAYDALAGATCTETILDAAFTGNVPVLGPLAPGVYCFPAAVTFTDTTLVLDGPSDGIWIFLVNGALTGTNFTVVMEGGGSPCNVYWWVADAVTMTGPKFKGTILAGADITFTGPGSLTGSALAGGAGFVSAPTGAVTLTDIAVTGCGDQVVPPDSDYWNDYWNEYWKEYWQENCEDHCKYFWKDCCKHNWKDCWKHNWKDCWKHHGKDCDKDSDSDSDSDSDKKYGKKYSKSHDRDSDKDSDKKHYRFRSRNR
ncbi:MAG: DUF3494 domain-containing protein [Desulfobacterales bacterium]|nr:DUF3494 domain-containing protein [Desulfobacterales bacterium]